MRSIVFSTVSHLDMYTGEDRKDRWRPLLELLRIHDFKVDRLYFFISHLYRHIVPTLVKDMNNVCPETEIVPVITNLNGVLTYEDIAPAYKVFSAYFEQYRFDLSNERYFFHLPAASACRPGSLFPPAFPERPALSLLSDAPSPSETLTAASFPFPPLLFPVCPNDFLSFPQGRCPAVRCIPPAVRGAVRTSVTRKSSSTALR